MAIKTTLLITILIVIIVFVSGELYDYEENNCQTKRKCCNHCSYNAWDCCYEKKGHDYNGNTEYNKTLTAHEYGNMCVRKVNCKNSGNRPHCCYDVKKNEYGNGGAEPDDVKPADVKRGWVKAHNPHIIGNMCEPDRKVDCKYDIYNSNKKLADCCYKVRINKDDLDPDASPRNAKDEDVVSEFVETKYPLKHGTCYSNVNCNKRKPEQCCFRISRDLDGNGKVPERDVTDEDLNQKYVETVLPHRSGNNCDIDKKINCKYDKNLNSTRDDCCYQLKINRDNDGDGEDSSRNGRGNDNNEDNDNNSEDNDNSENTRYRSPSRENGQGSSGSKKDNSGNNSKARSSPRPGPNRGKTGRNGKSKNNGGRGG